MVLSLTLPRGTRNHCPSALFGMSLPYCRSKALKHIAALKPTVRADGDDDSSAVTLAMSLYVRTTTLQALRTLNQESALERVQIKIRLENLREDFARFSRELGTLTQ